MKKIFIIILIFVAIIITGCKQKPDDPVTITNFNFTDSSGVFSFDINDFKLEDLKLQIKYSDNTEEEVPVSLDMISLEEFDSLFTTGDHFITINYLENTITGVVTITSTEGSQSRIPSIVVYDIVNKVDDEYQDKYYTTGSGSYVSYQLQYEYDPTQVSDIEIVKNETLSGSFISNVNNGIITITYTQSERQTERVELFSILYQANQKVNFFQINEEYDNKFFDYNTNVFDIKNIAFYNR